TWSDSRVSAVARCSCPCSDACHVRSMSEVVVRIVVARGRYRYDLAGLVSIDYHFARAIRIEEVRVGLVYSSVEDCDVDAGPVVAEDVPSNVSSDHRNALVEAGCCDLVEPDLLNTVWK